MAECTIGMFSIFDPPEWPSLSWQQHIPKRRT